MFFRKKYRVRKGLLRIFFWLSIGALGSYLVFFHRIVNRYGFLFDVYSNKFFNPSKFFVISSVLNGYFYDTGKLDTGKMATSSLKAYVDAIGDPYTTYFTPEEESGFNVMLEGESDFEGIGAIVSKKDYYVLIEEVMKDSPAYKAGLKPLDRILAIDGESTKDMTISEAVKKIRGEAGTVVKLMIERIESHDPLVRKIFEVGVVRDKVDVPSVFSKIINYSGKKFGYLEISVIGEKTLDYLQDELENLKNDNLDGLIIDLRGNGGGILPISVQIASYFVPKDKLIVKAKYRSMPQEDYYSLGYGYFENFPLVVLTDGLTASAAEILTLALKYGANAILLGEKTFGKGTIQTMNIFDDGSALKFTIGKWYGANGKSINGTGIFPDVPIKFDYTGFVMYGFDNQLEKAKKVLFNLVNK